MRELTEAEKRRRISFAAASDGKLKFTPEEQARWTPFLHQTFNAIGPDVMPILDESYGRSQRARQAGIIELTLDANRMQMYSDITAEEEGVLCGLWIAKDRKTMQWLRKELNY